MDSRGRKRSRSPDNRHARRRSHHEQKEDRGKDRYDDWNEANPQREDKRGWFANRDYETFERRKEPSNVIMLRGVNPNTTQEKLTDVLKAFGPVEDVRLIKNKTTGESRGFAFVDFATVEEATAFMDYCGGILALDERSIQMDYSRQKDHPTTEYKDWLCAQCSGSNFARRSVCYLCQAPRPANPIQANVSEENIPSPVLVARGLNPLTTEEALYSVFSSFAQVKDIRLIRDRHTNQSRCFSFIEFNTTEEATYALQNSTHLQIDDHAIRISYAAKKTWDRTAQHSSEHEFSSDQAYYSTSLNTQVTANIALEQAQWATALQKQRQTTAGQPNTQGNDAPFSFPTAPVAYGQYGPAVVSPQPLTADPAAPGSGYVLDEASGYYYNALTGIYFDTKSRYYYNSITQQYLSQDPFPSHLPTSATPFDTAPASSAEVPEIKLIMNERLEKNTKLPAPEKEKKKKQKTVRDKKLSAELQRWNTKKKELQEEPAEPAVKRIKFSLGNVVASTVAISSSIESVATSEAGKNITAPVPETQQASADRVPTSQEDKAPISTEDSLSIVESKTTSTAEDILDLPPLCLLCRRQFSSIAALALHRERSKLHKRNKELVQERLIVHRMREATKQQNKAKAISLTAGQAKKKKKNRAASPTSDSVPSPPVGASENKGSQLLRKMGWKDGEGLGKSSDGATAPIEVVMRSERAGIGAESIEYAVDAGDSYQQATKKKARARLESLMKRD